MKKQSMKKFFLSLGLMLTALTLTNCTNNFDENFTPEVNGEEFTITADIDGTRTTTDGTKTTWAADDALNVFSGTGTYTGHGKFTFAGDGKFTGTINSNTDFTVENTWYAIYPYSQYSNSPASTTSGAYYSFGSIYQTQIGNSSWAHIASPLYGVATTAAGESAVNFEMKHLAGIVMVTVKNTSSAPITVTKIGLATDDTIIGCSGFINITGEEPVITARINNDYTYQYTSTALTVEEGSEIAAGASAEFYLDILPFTAPVGEKLTLSVTTAEAGTLDKTKTLTSALSIEAGHVQPFNFSYDKEAVVDTFDPEASAWQLVTDASTLAVGDKVIIAAAGYNFAMSTTQNNNNRGRIAITKAGDYLTYNEDVQVVTLEEGSKSGTYAFNVGTAGYLYAASSSSNYLRTETTLSANSSWTITITDGVATIKAQGTNTRNWMRYNNSNSIFSCYSDGQMDICLYKAVDASKLPIDITVPTEAVEIAYTATNAQTEFEGVTFALTEGWNITAISTANWLTVNYDEVNGYLAYTAEENTTEETREATVNVTATKEGFADVTATFTVIQAAKPGEGSEGPKTLWAETWTGGTAGEQPSAYGFEGTTVYGGATLTYANSSTNTKLYAEELAGGTTPELLLSKSNQTWTITNIPTAGCTEMTLTFVSNKTTFNISSSTTGVTVSGSGKSWTITTTGNVANFTLVFKNTGSGNARIDNIELIGQ